MIDATETNGADILTPAELGERLAADLDITADTDSEPEITERAKGKGGRHKKDCTCERCQIRRAGGKVPPRARTREIPVDSSIPEFQFEITESMLTDVFHGIGLSITNRAQVAPYQLAEAELLAKPGVHVARMAFAAWSLDPKFAPLAALLLLAAFQAWPRVVEYKINNSPPQIHA